MASIGLRSSLRLLVIAATLLPIASCGKRTSKVASERSYYHVLCPYCGFDGYWPSEVVDDSDGRALCDRSCNRVFEIDDDTPTTSSLPAQPKPGDVAGNYSARCPYCQRSDTWPMAAIAKTQGRARCSNGCGQVFLINAPSTTHNTATHLTPQTPVRPFVAENGSYFGELNIYGRPKSVHVNGYYRKDGTYVRGHYRSRPRR